MTEYFSGTHEQFVSGLGVGQKVSLHYLLQRLKAFGCEINEYEIISTLEDSMGYDRDSEVTLFAAPE